MSFSQFKKKLSSSSDINLKKIEKAYIIASEVHKDQKRESGGPYITHPLAVAEIVYKIGGNENMICSAILHDAIEDSSTPKKIENEIQIQFGNGVYNTVSALSKNPKIKDKTRQNCKYYEKIKTTMAKDINVFFVKAADIIHNGETVNVRSIEKQELWIKELTTKYIPIFENFFKEIPLEYYDMYHYVMNKLYQIVSRYNKKN